MSRAEGLGIWGRIHSRAPLARGERRHGLEEPPPTEICPQYAGFEREADGLTHPDEQNLGSFTGCAPFCTNYRLGVLATCQHGPP